MASSQQRSEILDAVGEVPIKRRGQDRKCFLELSAELREKVYNHYFSDPENYRCLESSTSQENHASCCTTICLAIQRFTYALKQALCKKEATGDQETNQSEGDDPVTPSLFPQRQDDTPSIGAQVASKYDERNVFNLERYTPVPGQKLNRIVINQEGYLHANIPALTCASKGLLAETWSRLYTDSAILEVHVNEYEMARVYDESRIFQLLKPLGVHLNPKTTIIILHGNCDKDTGPNHHHRFHNFRSWLMQHWDNRLPLFDANIEYMYQPPWNPNQTVYYSSKPGLRRKNATYTKELLELWKALRVLRDQHFASWKQALRKLIVGLEKKSFCQYRVLGGAWKPLERKENLLVMEEGLREARAAGWYEDLSETEQSEKLLELPLKLMVCLVEPYEGQRPPWMTHDEGFWEAARKECDFARGVIDRVLVEFWAR